MWTARSSSASRSRDTSACACLCRGTPAGPILRNAQTSRHRREGRRAGGAIGKEESHAGCHDWGCVVGFKVVRSSRPSDVASVVALDVGGDARGLSSKEKAFIVSYQAWLAAAHLVGGPVGDYMTTEVRATRRRAHHAERGRLHVRRRRPRAAELAVRRLLARCAVSARAARARRTRSKSETPRDSRTPRDGAFVPCAVSVRRERSRLGSTATRGSRRSTRNARAATEARGARPRRRGRGSRRSARTRRSRRRRAGYARANETQTAKRRGGAEGGAKAGGFGARCEDARLRRPRRRASERTRGVMPTPHPFGYKKHFQHFRLRRRRASRVVLRRRFTFYAVRNRRRGRRALAAEIVSKPSRKARLEKERKASE